MRLLDEKARLDLAVRLLRRRAGIYIAHQETGLSRNKLRALYRELHGRSAPSGQLPAIGCAIIQTRCRQVHASLFARLYERLGRDGIYESLDIQAVLAAQDLYQQLISKPPEIDFNGAWMVARDLRVGKFVLKFCGCCQVRYLVSENSRAPTSCPICALYALRESSASSPTMCKGPTKLSHAD
jgi:flagellar transcriptional activator FlhC